MTITYGFSGQWTLQELGRHGKSQEVAAWGYAGAGYDTGLVTYRFESDIRIAAAASFLAAPPVSVPSDAIALGIRGLPPRLPHPDRHTLVRRRARLHGDGDRRLARP